MAQPQPQDSPKNSVLSGKQPESPSAEPTAPPKLPRDVRVAPERHKLLQYETQDHAVTLEAGHTVEDLLTPSYWSAIAGRFKQYDEIRVRRDDDSVYGRLLVIDSSRTALKVFVLEWHDLTKAEERIAAAFDSLNEFEIAKMGPHLKYCVIRKKDRAKVSEGHETRERAAVWLRSHVASQR